ncbi:MAG: thioredoxin family protein [Bacteroidales bacterium]|nr:thioredoxin family protein [Bacteroidales bacterium]MCI6101832.1 thioredoxin family protein [Bacteroidales bacterium]MDY4704975.1 cytochrome c biogenesis protein CcdA [Prevotella sp.]MDY4951729.1 cytochrome c biogenesis protein CcdA [Prevotella sp.]
MKRILTLTLLLVSAVITFAQNPVHFSSALKMGKGAEAEIVFTGKINKGWHVYSTNLGADGPIPATFHTDKMDGVELVGKLTPRGREISQYDNIFGMKLRYFENSVQFVQKIKFTKPNFKIDCYLEFGACNDEMCMPPTQVELHKSGKSPATAEATQPSPEELAKQKADSLAALAAQGDTVAKDSAAPAVTADQLASLDMQKLYQPVVKELKAQQESTKGNRSLWYIFAMGFVGGLLALLTPCVWPIIPMTVSFFLKRAKDDKKKGIRDAITYGVSIIVIFLLLALVVTALFGPETLNSLATNAVFNVFFFLLLVVFAVSFFGWFELTLPSSWGNKVDSKASSTTGLLSIFLMAFTLVLVSFSCTAPIVGLLLVEAATSGNWVGPTMGMFAFALALALPFTLFAMFPSWLKSAPRSGSWMNTIKIVLGFVELAFSLKFLSVADLAYGWHILDRETFLALWIVIFGAMGLYLIGKLKFQSDAAGGEIDKPMPVPCIMLGLCSIAFAVYMVPGLWGAPCKAVSAFAPPMYTQDFNLNTKEVRAAYTNYEEGMAAAKAQGKPVFLDFTGFGCVNCRKMEAAVWTDPTVADKLTKDYVLISLFVDDKTPLPEPIHVKDAEGNPKTLRTVGDKWAYLEQTKFGALTQPFYVPVDNDGNPLNGSFSYKEDVPEFLEFLNKGLENYRK